MLSNKKFLRRLQNFSYRIRSVENPISYRGFSANTSTTTTVDDAELRKFSALSQHWWRTDTNGPFIGLHYMNNVRIPLIRDALLQSNSSSSTSSASSLSTKLNTQILSS